MLSRKISHKPEKRLHYAMSVKQEALRLVLDEKYTHAAAGNKVGAPASCVTRWAAQKDEILAANKSKFILHPGPMLHHEDTEEYVYAKFMEMRNQGLGVTYTTLIQKEFG